MDLFLEIHSTNHVANGKNRHNKEIDFALESSDFFGVKHRLIHLGHVCDEFRGRVFLEKLAPKAGEAILVLNIAVCPR